MGLGRLGAELLPATWKNVRPVLAGAGTLLAPARPYLGTPIDQLSRHE